MAGVNVASVLSTMTLVAANTRSNRPTIAVSPAIAGDDDAFAFDVGVLRVVGGDDAEAGHVAHHAVVVLGNQLHAMLLPGPQDQLVGHEPNVDDFGLVGEIAGAPC